MSTDTRVAIVTGGGAGIGRACCLRFAAREWCVLIADVSEDDGHAAQELITQRGGQAVFCPGNVANEDHCHTWAKTALQEWGRVDALVANAAARVSGSILDATEEDWKTIVDVNLKGVAYCCKVVLPAMREQRSGAIVIISSANALVGRANMPLYDATKAGVLSLTRSLAVAHGRDGIRVNAVCPGFTITDYHERKAAARGISPEELRKRREGYGLLGRPAEPDEIAAAVCFLSADDASHITGQTLLVDGGRSVKSGT